MSKYIFCLLCVWGLGIAACSAQEKVLLAAEDDWYPYAAKVNGEAVGRSVDVVKAAFRAAEAELVLDLVPFNRGMIRTKEGRYAGVFNAGLNNDVRREYQIPKNVLALSEQVVVARKGAQFQGVQSFVGKRLSLTLGYTYPTDLITSSEFGVEYAPADINNLRKVAAKHVDFTILDRMVALSLLSKEPELKSKLEIVAMLHTEKIYAVFAKTEAGGNAMRLFDIGMDRIKRSGELAKINELWESKFR